MSPAPAPDRPDHLDLVAHALADGTRRTLLRLVRNDERAAGDLATAFPHMSRPAVSQHLRVLHDAGLVRIRAEGNRRLYRADRRGLAEMRRFVDAMWSDSLVQLKQAAERAERRAEEVATTETEHTLSDPTTETTTLEQTVRIAAAPETVWKFWTDPARLIEWWGGQAEIEPVPGGLFRVTMEDGPVMRGTFTELDPPRRIVFTFGWEQNAPGEALAPGSTRVEVTLTPDGNDTVLVLRHYDLPPSHAADHEKGWSWLVGDRLPAAAGEPR